MHLVRKGQLWAPWLIEAIEDSDHAGPIFIAVVEDGEVVEVHFVGDIRRGLVAEVLRWQLGESRYVNVGARGRDLVFEPSSPPGLLDQLVERVVAN